MGATETMERINSPAIEEKGPLKEDNGNKRRKKKEKNPNVVFTLH